MDKFLASEDDDGKRLDLFLSHHLDGQTRSSLVCIIKESGAKVNGKTIHKPAHRVKSGDVVECDISTCRSEPVCSPVSEQIPLSIIYEDSSIVVIDKPAGLVVHPAAGNWSSTLVNALLYHFSRLSQVGGKMRAGIVHRLDKGTSGLMVIAKTDEAHRNLARQFHDREVKKIYKALVYGVLEDLEGIIEKPIGRAIVDRKKISSHTRHGRDAVTLWKVDRVLGKIFTLLNVEIKTGRTHQIRVHLSESGHPIVGDMQYGGGRYISSISSKELQDRVRGFSHPALHSWSLSFRHPVTGEMLAFKADLPADFKELLKIL